MKPAAVSRRRCLLALASLFSLGTFAFGQEDDRPVVDDHGQGKEKVGNNGLPTLWIAGDSTVKCNLPMRGWGQDLGGFFDPIKINVVNRAIGGRSSRTFFNEGRWQEIVDGLKKDDFVMIQFGHNDVGPLDEKGKFRGSIKGIGDEVEKITKPDGSVEEVHSFGWYLKTFVRTAKAKGAKVILCSPIPHLKFGSDGKFVHDWKGWREWIEACAKSEGAAYVDLSEIVAKTYDTMDKAAVEKLFADKGTHTNADGSKLNAQSVITGLKRIPTGPLDRFMNEEGMKIAK
jgi:lysophospholipase L1-like esterase